MESPLQRRTVVVRKVLISRKNAVGGGEGKPVYTLFKADVVYLRTVSLLCHMALQAPQAVASGAAVRDLQIR